MYSGGFLYHHFFSIPSLWHIKMACACISVVIPANKWPNNIIPWPHAAAAAHTHSTYPPPAALGEIRTMRGASPFPPAAWQTRRRVSFPFVVWCKINLHTERARLIAIARVVGRAGQSQKVSTVRATTIAAAGGNGGAKRRVSVCEWVRDIISPSWEYWLLESACLLARLSFAGYKRMTRAVAIPACALYTPSLWNIAGATASPP